MWVLGVLGIGVGQLRLEGLGVFFELGDLRQVYNLNCISCMCC